MNLDSQIKFRYSYIEGIAQSFVMLYPPQQVIGKIYSLNSPTIIAIDPQKSRLEQYSNNITQSFNKIVHQFAQISKALTFIKNSHHKKIIVISPPQKIKNIKTYIFDSCENIYGLIQYPSHQTSSSEQNGKKIYMAQTEEQLLKILKDEINKGFVKRQLPNFFSIHEDTQKNTSLIFSILAMTTQHVNRTSVISELEKLISLVPAEQKHRKQFISFLLQQKRSKEETIRWYTKQTFLYSLLNGILRSNVHPFELYYFQPYFKDLFQSVRSLYSKQQKKRKGDFVCYRGGLMKNSQILFLKRNIGLAVKNMGFLSASSKKSMNWVINALFIIHVKKQSNPNMIDFGYASIKKYSDFGHEEEILFNPFSSFKVVSVCQRIEKQLQYIEVVLEYGILGREYPKLMSNPQLKDPHHYRQLCGFYINKMRQKNIQGEFMDIDPDTRQKQQLRQYQQYWQKVLQIFPNPQNKIIALQRLGMIEKLRKKNIGTNNGSIYFYQALSLNVEEQMIHASILSSLAQNQYFSQNYEKAHLLNQKAFQISVYFQPNSFKAILGPLSMRLKLAYHRKDLKQEISTANYLLSSFSSEIHNMNIIQQLFLFQTAIYQYYDLQKLSISLGMFEKIMDCQRIFLQDNSKHKAFFLLLKQLTRIYINIKQYDQAQRLNSICIHLKHKYRLASIDRILIQNHFLLVYQEENYEGAIVFADNYNLLTKIRHVSNISLELKKIIVLIKLNEFQRICSILRFCNKEKAKVISHRQKTQLELQMYQLMAGVYRKKQNSRKQLALLRKALTIFSEVYGRQTVKTTDLRERMANLLIQTQNYEEVLEHQQICYNFYLHFYGQTHKKSIITKMKIEKLSQLKKQIKDDLKQQQKKQKNIKIKQFFKNVQEQKVHENHNKFAVWSIHRICSIDFFLFS